MLVWTGAVKRNSSVRWLDLLAVAGLLLLPASASAQPPKPVPAAASAGPEDEALTFAPTPTTLQGLPLPFQAVAFSPDGKSLAAVAGTANTAGELRFWDAATNQ